MSTRLINGFQDPNNLSLATLGVQSSRKYAIPEDQRVRLCLFAFYKASLAKKIVSAEDIKEPKPDTHRALDIHRALDCDSAEKPYECFDWAQHERKISNAFKRSSVRPEVTRRMNGGFFSRIDCYVRPRTIRHRGVIRVPLSLDSSAYNWNLARALIYLLASDKHQRPFP